MSHLTVMSTEIKSLEAAKRAAQALGIPVLEGAKSVQSWYWGASPCDLVLGNDPGGYNFGLRREANGTYSLVGDSYDMPPSMKRLFGLFGDDFGGWAVETMSDPTGQRAPRSGHVTTGTPNRLMQEYALQVGELGARVNRMTSRRVSLKGGDVKLVITGGVIPAGGSVEILAKRDGSATVGGFGIEGPACLKVSDWALKVIGQITSQELTADFYHRRKAGKVAHVGALKARR